ncbi:hypothetical protein A3724_16465 [Alcanivorax sp. HI0033]|nr:hypothetical protein A3717_03450 [Alcanivorax sp. HI0013]KZX91485.1 hypothetical protein A3717_26255 [Alcanivorax sp. HI0013]KZY09476.1 hypothetical protein A3724_16465 [Alcanivorax sp. HI0033]
MRQGIASSVTAQRRGLITRLLFELNTQKVVVYIHQALQGNLALAKATMMSAWVFMFKDSLLNTMSLRLGKHG